MLLTRPGPGSVVGALPQGVVLRAPTRADTTDLGRLYFESYEPGVACATEAEAIEDIRATFDGAYGPLSADQSWLAVTDGALAGALLVVDRAPWLYESVGFQPG